jgi:hypothetical protein
MSWRTLLLALTGTAVLAGGFLVAPAVSLALDERTLTGPDESPAELAASVGPPGETCRARSLLDRRRACSGVDVLGNRVVLHVRYDRSSAR